MAAMGLSIEYAWPPGRRLMRNRAVTPPLCSAALGDAFVWSRIGLDEPLVPGGGGGGAPHSGGSGGGGAARLDRRPQTLPRLDHGESSR